jgi:hypothetical protein
LQNLRCETSRTFREKKREYLRDKINELEIKIMKTNIRDFYRGINEFKDVTNLALTLLRTIMGICLTMC